MDLISKESYVALSDIQEQVRKTMLEFKGERNFKNCYLEAEAVCKHYFAGAEYRSYFEELCIILAAWQIAAGLFPTVEVPTLTISDSPNKLPIFTYKGEPQ